MRRVLDSHSLREYVVAVGFVATLLVLSTAYSGIWPPFVVVESGSMMHPYKEVGYGRVGTLDPGDVVLVRKVDSPSEIRLWVERGSSSFGSFGDVVVYQGSGNLSGRMIIHRAITYVRVHGYGNDRTFEVLWTNGTVFKFGPEGIYLPELGFDESNPNPLVVGGPPMTRTDGYRPTRSGFLTRGDNAQTNRYVDQLLGISPEPVPFEAIEGVAVAEIPWVGLVKLSFSDHFNDYQPNWIRMPMTNAYAPADLWTMFFITLALLASAFLAWDVAKVLRRRRREKRGEPLRTTESPLWVVWALAVTGTAYSVFWVRDVLQRLNRPSRSSLPWLFFPGVLLVVPTLKGSRRLWSAVTGAQRPREFHPLVLFRASVVVSALLALSGIVGDRLALLFSFGILLLGYAHLVVTVERALSTPRGETYPSWRAARTSPTR